MILLGLAGPAGAGKDTVADLLVARHGWEKFSFSDELYREVAAAFGVPEALLRDRGFKEHGLPELALRHCDDDDFVSAAVEADQKERPRRHVTRRLIDWRSPRWILQRWGTDYRRAEDPDYWVKEAHVHFTQRAVLPGRPPGMANTSVRFPNEAVWIRRSGGLVCHVRRPGYSPESDYVSERPVPVSITDQAISNSGTLDELAREVDSLVEWLHEITQPAG